MPTRYGCKFWESNPRRWARCLRAAGAAMVAQGWLEKAGKFNQVRRRRAERLWREGYC